MAAVQEILKVDIAKAFDSVAWPFLLEVLQHIGFHEDGPTRSLSCYPLQALELSSVADRVGASRMRVVSAKAIPSCQCFL